MMWCCSSAGDLYEYDRKSKPSWKRHIWHERTAQAAPLMPSKGCSLPGLSDDHSESLFLLTKVWSLQVFYEHSNHFQKKSAQNFFRKTSENTQI